MISGITSNGKRLRFFYLKNIDGRAIEASSIACVILRAEEKYFAFAKREPLILPLKLLNSTNLL